MSRVQITDTVIQPAPEYLKGVDGASVTVTHRGGGAANLYQQESGGGTWANPLTTRDGRIEPNEQAGAPVWVDVGSYDIVVSGSSAGSYTTALEAISGDNIDATNNYIPNEGRNPALTLGTQPQVVTADFNAEPDHPGGCTGLRINRTDNTYAIGVKFTVGDLPTWDIGLDAGTTDFVLAYDADEPADQIRLRKGGHLDIARSCGHPTDTHRLQISSDNLDDAALRDIVVIDATAGSPAVNALVCIENTVAKFVVAKNGNVTAQGDIVSGKSGGIMQASRANFGSTGPATRAVNIGQVNVGSAYGGIGLNNTAGRQWSLLSGVPAFSESYFSIRDDTAGSTRLIISDTGFGFNGVAPARPALAAAATDAATTQTLANSLRSALITLGLTT